jgi:sugar-specific transcriptional regulator TrmB
MRIPYQEKDFFSLLEESGYFDSLEIDILDAMLSLKKDGKREVTANEISKEAEMSVTNAYKYLYSLKGKGLIEFKTSGKNKIFWLAESSNPFPRLFSGIGKEFLRKRKLFERLENLYRGYIPVKDVWRGEKIKESFDEGFPERIAYLFDIAKDEILIFTKQFYDDYIILDAIKRAVSRGVKMRIITEIADQELIHKMKTAGVNLKIGFGHGQGVIVDSRHGLNLNMNGSGEMFLNYNTEYKSKFEELWENADSL